MYKYLPWSRTSLIDAQFGHWTRASKVSGKSFGTSWWIAGYDLICSKYSGRTPINRWMDSFDHVINFECVAVHVVFAELISWTKSSVRNGFGLTKRPFTAAKAKQTTTQRRRNMVYVLLTMKLKPKYLWFIYTWDKGPVVFAIYCSLIVMTSYFLSFFVFKKV